MKKAVITGVTGFIGFALAKKLLTDGVKVYGVGRNREKLDSLRQYGDFVPVAAGFEDYGNLDGLIGERGFDMFWHFAWQGIGHSYNDCNVQIVNIKAACDAVSSAVKLECKQCGFSGSYYQAIVSNGGEIDFNPLFYGVVKKSASDLFKCAAYTNNMPCVNMIFTNAYGKGEKSLSAVSSVVIFIKKLLKNEPLDLISGIYPDDWIYIDDLVGGILAAANSGKKYGDYYIGHKNITTFKEKLTVMKTVLSSESELRFGVYPETYHVDYSLFDLDELYRDTGFEPKMSFEDGILETSKWINCKGNYT